MSKNKNYKVTAGCPVGKFFMSLETIFGATSEMSEHLNKSQLELLKAIRTFVDGRIENLEKKHASKRKKRMTKIKVE
jgi:hypothetical protein